MGPQNPIESVFDRYTGTSCDADSVFHPRYFEWLGYKFVDLLAASRRHSTTSRAHEVIFQAPILYNFHLHEAPFFVRVTGLMRSFFMQVLDFNVKDSSTVFLSVVGIFCRDF